ncbi:MAG: class I SAM-dependent methyltransferase [Elusimicrobia bacterium]|nr:class I SAM-dependent methyltransferase [Elusimicrobiota bacterium]
MQKSNPAAEGPEITAVRVALWRALHVEVDAPPPVLHDDLGLRLAAPPDGWRRRPDMDPMATRRARASILGRARFIEETILSQAAQGIGQYVLLGAGLDTFAQRRAIEAPGLRVFEIDRPGPQAWKQKRLRDLGFDVSRLPVFVPVDFESGERWWDKLVAAGFDPARPAVAAATGLTMYLSMDANRALLTAVARLAPGSTAVFSFMVPVELVDEEERPLRLVSERGARAAGTPMVSFFTPADTLALAKEAGFKTCLHVSSSELARKYFAGRADGLRPSSSEELLVVKT